MSTPLISVIMPAYNAEGYIGEAIASVQAQTWSNWELLVVDNASTDNTSRIVASAKDDRIRFLEEPERGVSKARNRALEAAQGELYCFLDADDFLPPESLRIRAEILLRTPSTLFADGAVMRMDHLTGELTHMYTPSFQGVPFDRLMQISNSVFFGPSWMIKRTPDTDVRFPEHMRHAEDLAFYLSIARYGRYDHSSEVVLHYRQGHGSAMNDLSGLWLGYKQLYNWVANLHPAPEQVQLDQFWTRIKRIMSRSFLKFGRPNAALQVWLSRAPTAKILK
ncbi:MAG: glycosyltransferase [Flavobacteriales bacterium]